MSLFPLLETGDTALTGSGQLPLAREIAWDFKKDRPRWEGGRPVYVTGAEAVLVWAWNALHTGRGEHDVFTWEYGQDLAELTGQPYSDGIRQSEAVRRVREALLVSPYIEDVSQVSVNLEGSTLFLTCRIKTIYGEVAMDGAGIAL